MPDDNAATKSIGARSAGINCHQPDIEGLTNDQLWALHLCKHEIAAAVHRLYPKVPPEQADPLVIKQLQKLILDMA